MLLIVLNFIKVATLFLLSGEVAVITVGVVVSILFLAGPLVIIIIIKLKKKQGK